MTNNQYKLDHLSETDFLLNNKIGIENSFKLLGIPPIITEDIIVVLQEGLNRLINF